MATVPSNNTPAERHIDADALGPYNRRAYRVTLVDASGNPVTSLGGNSTVNQGTGSNASPWYVQWSGQSVSVSNFPATQPVNGTVSVGNFPALQPVSIDQTSTNNVVAQGAGSGTVVPWTVSARAIASAGGITVPSRLPSSAATNNATTVKASAGRLYKIRAYNTTNTIIRLKIYNKGSAVPNPANDTPFDVFVLVPGYNSFDMSDIGWYLGLGIGYVLVTGVADTDNTAVAAGAVTDLSIGFA